MISQEQARKERLRKFSVVASCIKYCTGRDVNKLAAIMGVDVKLKQRMRLQTEIMELQSTTIYKMSIRIMELEKGEINYGK